MLTVMICFFVSIIVVWSYDSYKENQHMQEQIDAQYHQYYLQNADDYKIKDASKTNSKAPTIRHHVKNELSPKNTK